MSENTVSSAHAWKPVSARQRVAAHCRAATTGCRGFSAGRSCRETFGGVMRAFSYTSRLPAHSRHAFGYHPPVTIRKTLLVAFLSVGLLSAILLASLAFVKARAAVQAEIERNLAIQAAGVAADIDKMMFERLQNAANWSQLDITQDMQVHDVDKRLSHFLAGLHAGYKDVYLNLSCVDPQGRVVSSSDAAQVGQRVVSQPAWLRAALSEAKVELESPVPSESGALVMRVPLVSAFASGTLGQLRL